MEPRIKPEHWVHAHLRRCAIEAVPAFVIRHGDNERGMVLLNINTLGNGCKVLIQARDISGKLGWLAALNGDLIDEAAADSYIERQVRSDPDLWVVEIEDREGRRWFDGEEI